MSFRATGGGDRETDREGDRRVFLLGGELDLDLPEEDDEEEDDSEDSEDEESDSEEAASSCRRCSI